MPSSRHKNQFTATLPPALVADFMEAMPQGYKKNALVAAALCTLMDVEAKHLPRVIEDAAERYKVDLYADARSKGRAVADAALADLERQRQSPPRQEPKRGKRRA